MAPGSEPFSSSRVIFDAAVDKKAIDRDVSILNAVGRAKVFKLCLRRIWAVAASLPDREKSLPTLIPDPDMFSVPSHNRQHHEHEQCTFDFCEHSRVDFTSVAQHHEHCRLNCGHVEFPLKLLKERVENGKSTAWKLNDTSFLDIPRPYMAVSHVWADGTGTGTWGPGKVNKCLCKFLCDIARHFQCEGYWWDTISIPLDDKTRSKALSNMHNNYADARITLVHDLYLRQWEWVDAETACFAIVMSPWYSRGWTSLELAKSRKVMILFKARNDEYVIKDLDVDILGKIKRSSRHYATAESIRKLRNASIQTFGDLLAILGPRDTSKPRDIPIISGLLAGVDVSGWLSQQEIYQRILRKLGNVAQGHLFHNSATMSAPGFSWCPTNILDMPLAESQSALLELRENGDLEGVWRVYATDRIEQDDFIWKGTHPLTEVSLRSALSDESKEKHLLLVEKGGERNRALLVMLMVGEEEMTTMPCCRFVGPVYFRSALGGSNENENYREIKIRIGSTERMKELTVTAWQYVCSTVKGHKALDKALSLEDTTATGRRPLHYESKASFGDDDDDDDDDDDPISMDSTDWKALFYSEREASESLLQDQQRLQVPHGMKSYLSEDMALHLVCDGDFPATCRAFYYGKKNIRQYVQDWLGKEQQCDSEQIMLLVLDENHKIKVDSDDTSTMHLLAGNALLLAIEQVKGSRIVPLIALLLDNCAQYNSNPSGHRPLHLAVEHNYISIVKQLLGHSNFQASAGATNENGECAIHIAARKGHYEIAMFLIDKIKNLDAQEGTKEQTALHLAAENCQLEIAQLLLERGADLNIPDMNGNTALHNAASRGHSEIVTALLEHAIGTANNKMATSPHSIAASGNEKVNDEINEKTNKNTNKNTNGDALCKSAGKSDEKTRRLERRKMANPDVNNNKRKTALHLAAENGHEGAVKILIDYGANAAGGDKQTALLLAAQNGHVKVIQVLLDVDREAFKQTDLDKALLSAAAGEHKETIIELHQGGARSGTKDDKGMTALHRTIRAEIDHCTNLLIEKQTKAGVNIEDGTGQSALLLAAARGMRQAVAVLLSKGANVYHQDTAKRTALHWAVSGRHIETITELLKVEHQDGKQIEFLNTPDNRGRTALHYAARRGSTEALQLLLQAGAHHVKHADDGRSALIWAARKRHAAAVQTLLNTGSDATACGHDNKTALDWAAMLGSEQVVRELLPKIEADKAKQQALELAADGGHLSVAMTLHKSIEDPALRAAAFPTVLFAAAAIARDPAVISQVMERVTDPNCKDPQGRTALMLAVKERNPSLAGKLLELNADTNTQDTTGRTALIIATKLGDEDLVQMLLLARADPNIQDSNKCTALHYAAESRFVRILYSLLKSQADFDILDSHGRTALHIATKDAGFSFVSMRSFLFRLRSRGESWLMLIHFGATLDIKDEEGQTPLHWAVRSNRKDIVQELLKSAQNRHSKPITLDIKDDEGRTPLLLAAERGHVRLVRDLLKFNFNPNTQDNEKRTPLLLAAEGGHSGSVEELLKVKADPTLYDLRKRTALSLAAQNGYVEVVNKLLETKLNVSGDIGWTALLLAAEKGHAPIVDNLLRCGANSTIVDYDGKKAWQKAMDKGHASVVRSLLSDLNTPTEDRKNVNEALLLASRKGWIELVEVLLDQEADVTFQGKEGGWSALHMAAMGGHQEVVKMLLRKSINIIIKDDKGRTALMQATEHGFESIVGLLLDRDEVQTDIESWMGQEALLFAAEKGYTGIVQLLLKSHVDYNTIGSAGRTAIIFAAANGNGATVELLLKNNADCTIKDNYSWTAMHHAAWGGYDAVVKILLEHKVDFRALDDRGQSALHLAAERASHAVVKQLLKNKANANAKSRDGQTVLHRAAWGGSYEVIMLLRQNGADPFIRDNLDKKPWQIAAEKGHESIVKELLEEEESVYDECILAKKGLLFAAQRGYAVIARSLLEKGAASAVKDKEGWTPLHWAAMHGYVDLVGLLLEKGEGSINASNRLGQTALCQGVLRGQTAAVEKLLQNEANANITDKTGRTVLHHAAKAGNLEIVQMLVKYEADPHARDHQWKKAWQLAADAGYHQIVSVLLEKEVDLNPRSQKFEELLRKMAKEGRVHMVRLLLTKGVNINAADRSGRVAISLAAEHGKDEVLGLLLSENANPGIPDLRGQTPLLWAAKTGKAKIISSLLNKVTSLPTNEAFRQPSADRDEDDVLRNGTTTNATETSNKATIVNHCDSENRTALLIAVEEKYDNVVKLLLNRGSPEINVNLADKMDRTALQLVAERGNRTLVQLLLKREANRDLRDKLGRTALLLAAEQGNNPVVETLLDGSSDSVDISDFHGRTALHVATERGDKSMIETLLGKEADATRADIQGRTPLLIAAENGNKEVVDLLLKHGSGCAKKDALRIAIANGAKAVVKILLDHREVDVDKDLDGDDLYYHTLLDLAVQSGNRDVTWYVSEKIKQIKDAKRKERT